jgi:hypothetical protein
VSKNSNEQKFELRRLKAMKKYKDYVEAGLEKELEAYFSDSYSGTRVRDIFKSEIKFHSAGPQEKFLNRIESVPELQMYKNSKLYIQILQEIGSDDENQIAISKYQGIYKIVMPTLEENRSERESARFGFMKIISSRTPLFNAFVVKYRSLRISRSYVADGMLFMRGGRVYMIGTHRDTTLLGHFIAGAYPEREPLFGKMTFECIADDRFVDGPFAMVRDTALDGLNGPSLESYLDTIREGLNISSQK